MKLPNQFPNHQRNHSTNPSLKCSLNHRCSQSHNQRNTAK